MFLKVTPMTGVGRVLKSRKLTPKFLGPYQILKRIGPMAYLVALLPSLSNLHPVFHVSQLRQYNPDPSHVIEPDKVQVRENLTFKAQPARIVDRRIKQLRRKEVALVKVQWSADVGDATWELKDKMWELHPSLFLGELNSGTKFLEGWESCNFLKFRPWNLIVLFWVMSVYFMLCTIVFAVKSINFVCGI